MRSALLAGEQKRCSTNWRSQSRSRTDRNSLWRSGDSHRQRAARYLCLIAAESLTARAATMSNMRRVCRRRAHTLAHWDGAICRRSNVVGVAYVCGPWTVTQHKQNMVRHQCNRVRSQRPEDRHRVSRRVYKRARGPPAALVKTDSMQVEKLAGGRGYSRQPEPTRPRTYRPTRN